MQQYRKLTTLPFSATAFFLFLLLPIFQALASENDTIRQYIKKVASEHALLDNSQVNIYVEDGFVLLTGTVQLYKEKMDFEQIAWKTTGVTEVENEIEVNPLFPPNDIVIKKKIQIILMGCKCFHGGNYLVQVAEGMVSVTGVFFNPRDVQFLKRQVAEIEGVVSIDIHATALLAKKQESRQQ